MNYGIIKARNGDNRLQNLKRRQQMLLIRNGYVKTMAGEDMDGGSVLIGDNGKILAVGTDLAAPEGTVVIDAGGKLVTPGCVDAHCHIGLDNEGMGWEGHDYNEMVDPITPQMRAIDSINPQDEAFGLAIQNGVTSACTGPGSANVVGGTFIAIKLYGKRVDKMVIKNPIAMKCAFGENPKRCYGQSGKKAPMTRMGTAALLRELLFKTRRYLEDKEAGKNPGFDMKLEAMIPVVKGELPLKAHAHRADDILTAIRIAREFDIPVTLDHCRRTNQYHHRCSRNSAPISPDVCRTCGRCRIALRRSLEGDHYQSCYADGYWRSCRQFGGR